MHEPLISVIIPTYNSADTITTAIQSILDQTYKNLEVIVVDDSSTDATKQIVEHISEQDSRVKYFLLPYKDPKRINWRGVNINAGYMARNYGFEKARGEWITFQDSDDASLLNRIEVEYTLAIEHNAIHVCIEWQQLKEELLGKKLDCDRIFQEKSNVIITSEEIIAIANNARGILMADWLPHQWIPFIFKWFPPTRKLFFRTTESYPGAGNNPLFKREVIDKVQFRQLDYRVWPSTRGRGADRDFNFQVAITFKKSMTFKLPLYLWRVRGQNPEFTGYEKYII